MHMVTDVSMDYLVTFVPPISHFLKHPHPLRKYLTCTYLEIGVILIGERSGSGLLELFLVLSNESLVDLDLRRSESGGGDKLEGLVTNELSCEP